MAESGMSDWFCRLRDLVIPDECGACGSKPPPGKPLCRPCADVLAESSPRTRTLSQVPILAAGEYDGVLRDCLLTYKEQGRRDLAAPLARLMSYRLSALCADPAAHLVLVPVPSTRRARRDRGFDHLRELTSCLVRLMPKAMWTAALSVRARPDSAGLGRGERYRIATASLRPVRRRMRRLRRVSEGLRALRVVLVDDIVTSGATLDAACEVLSAAGVRVSGAVAAASAESDTDRRVTSP